MVAPRMALVCVLVFVSLLVSIVTSSLTFTIEPADATVVVGQSLILNCKATDSSGAAISINWKKDSHWLVDSTNQPWRQLRNNSLYYASLGALDVGAFMCGAVSGGSPIVYSRTAKVQLAYISAMFTANPNNRTKRVGDKDTDFACVTGDSKPFASVYWEKDGVKLTGHPTTSMIIPADNPRWTSASLSVKNIVLGSAGFYRCVAVNPMLPNQPKKSEAAYLHVLPAIDKPHFYVRPASTTITEHQTGILQCVILGVPTPQVSWIFNGQALQASPDRHMLSNGSLYFRSANRSMAGAYVCSGTNNAGSVSSTPVFVSVAYFDFVFFKHPSDQNATEGSPVSFECDPPSSYPRDVQVNWFRNYQPVQAGSDITISSTGTLRFAAIRKTDEGQYFCNGVNTFLQASRTSNIATLTVWVIPTFQLNPPNITVIQYQSLLLNCKSTGYPQPTVTWSKDNKAVDTSHVTTHSNGSLAIARTLFGDKGKYACVATNIAGSAMAIAMVTIYVPPTVSRPPANATRTVGEPQTFICEFQGFPAPAMEWFHNNGTSTLPVPATPNYVISGGTLTIRAVVKAHEGTYICKGKNPAGMAEASAYLYIKVPVSLDAGPVNITVNETSTASFQCRASGDPNPTVTWYKGQVSLSHGGRIVIGGNTLSVLRTKASDAGEYRCKVTNGLATHFGIAHLIVQVAPIITTFMVPTFAQLRSEASMGCTVSGSPPPTITWYKDGNDVTADGSRVKLLLNGTLSILGVTKADGGAYSCLAANEAGMATRVGTLTVQVEPDPLTSLSAIPLSSTSIRLSWKPGFNGHSAITDYKVEQLDGSSYTDVANGIVGTSYTVARLRPFTAYTFRVRAKNAIGLGNGADVTNRTMEDAPSEPTNVAVTSLNSTSLNVTWSTPASPNGVITWYEITYKTKGGSSSVKPLPVSSLPHLTVIISRLLPYKEYVVSLRAATGRLVEKWGNSTAEVVERTGEAAPSVAPTDVQLNALNGSTAQVAWQPIPAASANGVIRAYRVSYHAVGPYHFSSVTIATTSTNILLIRDLHSWTDYSVSVQAVTVRPGPASASKVVRTRESAPSGPPLNVTLTTLSANSIRITMATPDPHVRNGNITGFNVYYKAARSSGPFSLWVTTDSMKARLNNLTTYTEYLVRVAALTSAGEGVWSEAKRTRTAEGVPGEVSDVTLEEASHNHVIITWKAPHPPTGIIQHYRVTFNTSANESYSTTTTDTTVTLSSLVPKTTYAIWVVAKTSAGYGPKGRALIVRTVNPPIVIPTTSPPTEPATTQPNTTVIVPNPPQKRILSERDMIIVIVCVGVIALAITILAVYFILIRSRTSYRRSLSSSQMKKKRRQGAIDMENLRGESPDKRPVLDVHEETTSIGDDSFDDGSEWTSTVTGMHSEPASEPIVVVLPGNATPILQPVTRPVTQPNLQQSLPVNSSNQNAGGATGSDRSPLTQLRNKKLSMDSVEGSLYDQPYSSVDELGTGFSSFTPAPPVDFRSEPDFSFESAPDASPVSADRRSFTNLLYKAVRDENTAGNDGGPEVISPEPEVILPAPYFPPDVEGFENEGYDTDEELDNYLATAEHEPVNEAPIIPEIAPPPSPSALLYGPVKEPSIIPELARRPSPSSFLNGLDSRPTTPRPTPPSSSPPQSPSTSPPRSPGTSRSASFPADCARGSPEPDLYAKVDFSKKKKKRKSASPDPEHDAVVVYDERTNL